LQLEKNEQQQNNLDPFGHENRKSEIARRPVIFV
jgi:hypothetical protein